jgi:hypothetical protein
MHSEKKWLTIGVQTRLIAVQYVKQRRAVGKVDNLNNLSPLKCRDWRWHEHCN